MGRMALLHHSQSDAGDHHDLLLERDVEADRRAITFRIDRPLDLFEAAEFDAERIRDHRAVYLDYEGPVPAPTPGTSRPPPTASGPQGRVERVLNARCTIHIETPDLLDFTLDDAPRHARFIAERVAGSGPDGLGEWRFTRS